MNLILNMNNSVIMLFEKNGKFVNSLEKNKFSTFNFSGIVNII